ncbi:hypothetical protein [Paractinoplanes atraurantiacus]|uniref:hypothetical protein n=1 Tax=Paractinoplanes atraurantiacus TaxID=1036182 RepID=UPI0034DABDE2
MQDGAGRKPRSVNFWFSLGHSTIVFGLAFLLSFGVKAPAHLSGRRAVRARLRHRHRGRAWR